MRRGDIVKLQLTAFLEGSGVVAFEGEAPGNTLAEAAKNYKAGDWYAIDGGGKYTLVPAHCLKRLEFTSAEPEAVPEPEPVEALTLKRGYRRSKG